MEGASSARSGKRLQTVEEEQKAEIEEMQKIIINVRDANQKLYCENVTLKERLAQTVYSRRKAWEGTSSARSGKHQARTVEEKQRIEIENLQKQIAAVRQTNWNLYCENVALEDELAEQEEIQGSSSKRQKTDIKKEQD